MAPKGSRENMEPMVEVEPIPFQPKGRTPSWSADKGIDEMVGALCDPIIVSQGQWGTKDMIPEWLQTQITMDRLLELMKANKDGRDPTGTNSEALAFMIPASMEAPMGHDWTEIYLHLGTVVMTGGMNNKVMPEDIRVVTLNSMQQEDLARLKRWIYQRKVQHRAGRRKEINREIKEDKKQEKEKAKAAQPSMFDF